MIFKQIKVGPMQNFCYIIADEESKEAAVVDAGWETDRLIKIADGEKLKIRKIILTHSHYDHTQKAYEMARQTKANVYFHELEFDEIKKVMKGDEIKIIKLKGNDEIKIGNIKIKVIHTPGHTLGGICLLFENKLITGDTLFVNAIGRTDLAGGDPRILFESLQKLKKLNDSVEVYPGHDYGETAFSTIEYEKRNNIYFMSDTKEEFLKLMGMN